MIEIVHRPSDCAARGCCVTISPSEQPRPTGWDAWHDRDKTPEAHRFFLGSYLSKQAVGEWAQSIHAYEDGQSVPWEHADA